MYSIGKNLAVQSTADGLFAGPDANPGSAACRLVLRASLRHMPVPTRRIARAGRTRPSAGAGSILRQASGSRPRHDHHPRLQRLFSSRLAPSAEGGVDAGASQCRFLSLLTRKLAGDCSAGIIIIILSLCVFRCRSCSYRHRVTLHPCASGQASMS